VDATLSDEQQMLAEMAGSIAREMAVASSAEIGRLDTEAGRQLLAEVGLLSLRLPPDLGGGAASAVEVAIVTEEFARRLCPVAFAGPMIASELFSRAGVGDEVLASMGAGRRPVTVAVDRTLVDIARYPGDEEIVAWDAVGAEETAVLMAVERSVAVEGSTAVEGHRSHAALAGLRPVGAVRRHGRGHGRRLGDGRGLRL